MKTATQLVNELTQEYGADASKHSRHNGLRRVSLKFYDGLDIRSHEDIVSAFHANGYESVYTWFFTTGNIEVEGFDFSLSRGKGPDGNTHSIEDCRED